MEAKLENPRMILLNYIENNNLKQNSIAKMIDVSPATISNFIKDIRILSFEAALKIQRLVFKSNPVFIKSICRGYDKREYVHKAMEYLSINYYLDDVKFLLDKISDYPELDDLYSTYSLVTKFQEKSVDFDVLLDDIHDVYYKVKKPELITLLLIIKSNIFSITREYKSLYRTVKQVEKHLDMIDGGFIKESLSNNLDEILAEAELFQGNLTNSEIYANKIKSNKMCDKSVAFSSYILGTSFMFRDYNKAIELLNESIGMYNKIGFKQLSLNMHQNVYLVDSYWRKNVNDVPEDMSDSEKAHRYAIAGESDKSLEILDRLSETPFRTYYRALATNDPSLHFKAYTEFIGGGDMLYAKLPLTELEKDPLYSNLVK